MPNHEDLKEYLKSCSLDGEYGPRFTIGPFFSNGVTVLKQQVRAMNLIHAMTVVKNEETKGPILPVGGRLAVIGGGFAGITVAGAAAYLGREVHLFERRPVLCHLQHGCDTRYLHPHAYDWPHPGWDYSFADLPLLNWKAGTAAEVTEQIVSKFHKILDANASCKLYLGATTRLSGKRCVRWDNCEETRPQRGPRARGGQLEADVVVLATGFGVEKGVEEGHTPSYWRNDDINQPAPGITSERKQLCFISGTGDGGLIDLIRCRIKSFNQGWILDELFPPRKQGSIALAKVLREIANDWKREDRGKRMVRDPRKTWDSERWLFERYRVLLEDGRLNKLRKKIKRRLRSDTLAILNGTAPTFSESLTLATASMLNTLITFLMYDLDAFSYVSGSCQSPTKAHEVTIDYHLDDVVEVKAEPLQKEPPADHVYALATGLISGDSKGKKPSSHRVSHNVDRLILRHGSDLRKNLLMVGITGEDISKLQKSQIEFCKNAKTDDGGTPLDGTSPLWPAVWWSKERKAVDVKVDQVEFVPPATIALATTFVSSLSEILYHQQKSKMSGHHSGSTGASRKLLWPGGQQVGAKEDPYFRITLHRLLSVRKEFLFQQIAYYGGVMDESKTPGKPGRVFSLELGLVGLACRLGGPIILYRGEGDEAKRRWEHLWRELKVNKDAGVNVPPEEVHSMLACPFFAPAKDDSDKLILAVLFMDSEVPGLFFGEDVIKTIFNACQGFIRNLDQLVQDEVVRFSARDFRGYVPEGGTEKDQKIMKNTKYRHIIDTRSDGPEVDGAEVNVDNLLDSLGPKLKFDRVDSFDSYIYNVSSFLDPEGSTDK